MIDGVRILLGVAFGLDTLHNCGLIHGDLNPESILLIPDNAARVLMLVGFGLSMDGTGAEIHLRSHVAQNTLRYLPLEQMLW